MSEVSKQSCDTLCACLPAYLVRPWRAQMPHAKDSAQGEKEVEHALITMGSLDVLCADSGSGFVEQSGCDV